MFSQTITILAIFCGQFCWLLVTIVIKSPLYTCSSEPTCPTETCPTCPPVVTCSPIKRTDQKGVLYSNPSLVMASYSLQSTWLTTTESLRRLISDMGVPSSGSRVSISQAAVKSVCRYIWWLQMMPPIHSSCSVCVLTRAFLQWVVQHHVHHL